MAEIETLVVPVLVSVISCVSDWPTATVPKRMWVSENCNSGLSACACCPKISGIAKRMFMKMK